MYCIQYNDGEVVKYCNTIAEAKDYVGKHCFDCIDRTLYIEPVYDGPNEWED